jgi:DNA-binding beta-propeller fold protein YncE
MRHILVAGGLALLAACQPQPAERKATEVAPSAAPATREIALIADSISATVSLLDVAQRKVVGVIDINPDKVVVDRPGTPNYAQDTDVSPDGKTLYVSRGYMGDVAAFDIATGRPLWVRKLDSGRADHMTLTPDGKWLFVSVMFDNQVEKIDAATGEGKGRFPTGVYPHDNQISKDGKHVYNTSLGQLSGLPAGTVPKVTPKNPMQFTIADIDTLEVTTKIAMPFGIRPWHMKHDESGFYAQLSNQHAVVAFDFPSGKMTKRLELPVATGLTEADWDFEAPHHGLSLSRDDSILCLAGRASDYVALVHAPDLTLLATIPVGDAPGWTALVDEDRVCLSANTRNDTVSFISVADRKEVARIAVGNGPKHITIARLPGDVIAQADTRRQ